MNSYNNIIALSIRNIKESGRLGAPKAEKKQGII